jgi:hypothetical protein
LGVASVQIAYFERAVLFLHVVEVSRREGGRECGNPKLTFSCAMSNFHAHAVDESKSQTGTAFKK